MESPMQHQIIAFGPRSAPIFSISAIIRCQAASNADKTALVFEGKNITYAEVWQQVKAIAGQLQALGIKQADKVALLMSNDPAFVTSFFAILSIGAVVVPISPLFKSVEINHILSDSRSKVVIAHEGVLVDSLKGLSDTSGIKHILVKKQPKIEQKYSATSSPGIQIIELADNEIINDFQDLNKDRLSDLAALLYTSGTTGKPKGAMLSHANLLSILPARLNMFNIDENDIALLTVPLYHIYGMAVIMLGTLAKGATLVMLPKFDAATALRIIESEKITLLSAVPTMYRLLLQETERTKYNLNSMRLCFSGGAPLDIELLGQIEQTFGVPVIEAYGMTESACLGSANPLFGIRKLGSVGKPLSGITIAIKDAIDESAVFDVDQVGEVAIKGTNIMLGYHNQPQATKETLKDGWLFTGDLGYLDKDGYLYIVGRKKELIIRGGLNIYPAEVERIIYCMPAVSDVAVIGIPDKTMGELIKAIIVLKPNAELSAEEIKAHCSEYLAPYKVPTIFEFRESLPRNTTGKLLKYLLS